MPEKTARPQPAPLRQPPTRIEYLDHRTEGDWREYRLAVHTPAGPSEVRFRIAAAAFAASRVLLQDGPGVCYQQLLLLATGDAPIPAALTVGEADLAAYREAHTPAPRGSAAPKPRPKPPATRPAPVPRPDPRLPVAAAVRPAGATPTFDEGQRGTPLVGGRPLAARTVAATRRTLRAETPSRRRAGHRRAGRRAAIASRMRR